MATELKKLANRLRELFQLDAEDLDFGMYRVLRLQRAAFHEFIDKTLVDTVASAFGGADKVSRAEIEAEIQSIAAMVAQVGGTPEKHPRYAPLRSRLAELVDSSALERQVYGRLDEFFSRYYDEGDFLSLPRWRGNTYAIPYNGEEVVLHWANKDQYYVKSGEYFARYSFEVKEQFEAKALGLVTFRLANAESDPDNQKTAAEKGRRFRLVGADPIAFEGSELVCRFEYVNDGGGDHKQDAINEESVATMLTAIAQLGIAEVERWTEALASKYRELGKTTHSLLSWHLRQYTEKNKRDYFIHKDLGGFLGRELDHYLKTEVFDLDAVDNMSDADVLRQRSLVKTIRAVAKPIIDFLAVTENFQKQLFLKKKMVLRTDWCISLDRVPDEFYAEIGDNKGQVQRWKDLFHIQEIEVPAMIPGGDGKGVTVSVEFLKRNTGLVVETRLFEAVDRTFTPRLLAALGKDIDEHLTGVMVKGENLQAIRLLSERYREQVDAVYTDPPYNTGEDGFHYKDGYSHSTWATMLADRLRAVTKLAAEGCNIIASINENELFQLRHVLTESLGQSSYIGTFSVKVRHPDRVLKGDKAVHEVTEYALLSHLAGHGTPGVREIEVDGYDGYEWAVTVTKPPSETRLMHGKSVEVFEPASFEIRRVPSSIHGLQRISIRGTLREGNSSGRFYVAHIETLNDTHRGFLFKVPGMGADGLGYRWFLIPAAAAGKKERKNGDYFQGVPLERPSIREVPFPNFCDFEAAFNNCGDEGGVPFRNGKKPVAFVRHMFNLLGGDKRTTLDFFAGSGTTGHAVLTLIREEGGKQRRRFILFEVNEYFDAVLVPRILRASYSEIWNDGKPLRRVPVPYGVFYKCLLLESYDDALANVVLPADNPLFNQPGIQLSDTIRYQLDAKTNRAVLDLDQFRKPFGWTTEVRRGGLVDPKHPVDLVETFNYLLGLKVSRYQHFGNPDELRYIEGTMQEHGHERRVLVLWRDVDAVSDDKILALFNDKEFAPISQREYDRIYINGDPPLANLQREDEHWKVLAIEDEFKRLAFANEGDT